MLGGGAIGAELSQVFARFGAQVTVIEESGRLLPPEDPEAAALLADVLGREVIGVRTSTTAPAVRHDGTAFTLAPPDGTEVTGDALLVAAGRRADLAGIRAGRAGRG